MFPSPDDALSEVVDQLFRRAPESKIEPSLDRVSKVLSALGDPQDAFTSIHVAGTNGKTSVTRMTDSLLRAFELRTGRYTSPHLESVTERIVIDGQHISAEAFVATYRDVQPALDLVESDGDRQLTFFEVITVMAFAAFADAPVSVASVEVGLGGTWDATNVVSAPVSVITPISMDHMDYLGDTLTNIAGEKAGVMKPGQLVVVGQQQLEAMDVITERASDVGCTVAREGENFGVLDRKVAVGGQVLTVQGLGSVYEGVFVPLHGAHQAHNAACALVAVEGFFGGGLRALDADVVEAGFREVSSPGRLEVLRRNPTVLADAAHNPAGAAVLAEAISDSFEFSRLVGVVGVLGEKDAEGILQTLEPVLDAVVITRSTSPRAIDPDDLADLASSIFGNERVTVQPSLAKAIEEAVELAEVDLPLRGGGVLVTGSITVVGEARALLHG